MTNAEETAKQLEEFLEGCIRPARASDVHRIIVRPREDALECFSLHCACGLWERYTIDTVEEIVAELIFHLQFDVAQA